MLLHRWQRDEARAAAVCAGLRAASRSQNSGERAAQAGAVRARAPGAVPCTPDGRSGSPGSARRSHCGSVSPAGPHHGQGLAGWASPGSAPVPHLLLVCTPAIRLTSPCTATCSCICPRGLHPLSQHSAKCQAAAVAALPDHASVEASAAQTCVVLLCSCSGPCMFCHPPELKAAPGQRLQSRHALVLCSVALGRPVSSQDISAIDAHLGASLNRLTAAHQAHAACNKRGAGPMLVDGVPLEDLCLTFVLPGARLHGSLACCVRESP